jgi:hypothetical protein
LANLAGKTIKLFLVDGIPDGMRTAEIMNWTGHVLFAPRSSVVSLLSRPEVKKTGAYLLIGPDPENPDQAMVYVGEGDNVGLRISSHNKDKDKEFWEHACVITSKDLNLTKGHVRYLESQLIKIITREGRATLANKSEPDFSLLPEADLADMDDFIGRLQILLPVLGADFIRPTPVVERGLFPPASRTSETASQENELGNSEVPSPPTPMHPEFHMNAGGLTARAVEIDGQMIVLKGSEARKDESVSLSANIKTYREQLMKVGKLSLPDETGKLHFTDDVAFTSPSAAAQAVMGTSRNGRTDWTNTATNETYAAWQDRIVAKSHEFKNLLAG